MKTADQSAWVEVFSGESFNAEVVKGLLESNGIQCIIEDHTSVFGSHYSGIDGDMRILVAPSDVQLARELLTPQ